MGKSKSALLLLKEMETMKVKPDEVTYNTIMHGYCRVGRSKEACSILDVMKRRGINLIFSVLIPLLIGKALTVM